MPNRIDSHIYAHIRMIVDVVAMALRTGQSLVFDFLTGGYSDDKGRSRAAARRSCVCMIDLLTSLAAEKRKSIRRST